MKPTIKNEDMLTLQSYVTAQDTSRYRGLARSTIMVDVSHSNLIQRHIELRFDLHDTVSDMKDRIYQNSGTPPAYQHLILRSGGADTRVLDNDNAMLGYYSLDNGMEVHCVDTDPNSGSRGGRYENTALVEKFRMSDADYDRRKGTLRDWGRRKKEADPSFSLSKHADEHRRAVEARRAFRLGEELPAGWAVDGDGELYQLEKGADDGAVDATSPPPPDAEPPYGPGSVTHAIVGARCQAAPGRRRGEVTYVGLVPGLGGGGHWVGVRFDEPVGKCDGSVAAEQDGGGGGTARYFECADRHGGFLRGKNVEVGDYPERDIFADSDDDSQDEL
eukprot:CAMPEP_0194290296 /NCGR_PEP_ID=MMETSP0169-20130528/40946_1 /TAXON_ID=218684 /ORGANISM="Corethron pennatum, Strain L29A3" /LENGTH=331 /DNA_ID=CAMNT_0039037839 /DNA_START=154 /DNA_END=1149 /DNA_ORIENTATION=+